MNSKKIVEDNLELSETIITNNEEISPGVYLLSFRRSFGFLPGQAVKISFDNDSPRIYTICSGSNDEEVSILFKIREDSVISKKLGTLIPGDKIVVSEPFGSFTGTEEPAWWIATGTGIAPFYSMFRSGQGKAKKLVHGVSYLNQFYFEDEFEWELGENYIRCCSRESSCDVIQQRVTDYLETIDVFPDVKYYICGNQSMVIEVRELLIERGVLTDNIIAEIYS